MKQQEVSAKPERRTICVFCGASSGSRTVYTHATEQLADYLAEQGIRLVYGGGSIGLMGILADRMLARGGEVVGVIPQYLCREEVMHPELTELHVTHDLLERKSVMMSLSDGFIALPGGLGTLDEILEVFTWEQLEQHDKPLGLVNTRGYFLPFLNMLDQAVTEGFVSQQQRDKLLVSAEPADLARAVLEL